MLRGARVATALHKGAQIFSNDRPCLAEHFALSEPVDYIDSFISHNWSTSRHRKFLVLLLHFNSGPAIALAIATAAAASCASGAGCLPRTFGFVAALLGNVVFLL